MRSQQNHLKQKGVTFELNYISTAIKRSVLNDYFCKRIFATILFLVLWNMTLPYAVGEITLLTRLVYDWKVNSIF